MERISITLEPDLLAAFDSYVDSQKYDTRSEAIRDILRQALADHAVSVDQSVSGHAVLSYAYNHDERELSKRLTKLFHAHHGDTVSSTHVHLNHDLCLEIAILKGNVTSILGLAREVLAQKGVVSGGVELFVLPV